MTYTATLVRASPNQSTPPDFEELGPMEGGLSWSDILSREREATATCLPESLAPNIKATLRDIFDPDPANIPWLELWITRDTIPVFRGPCIMPNWTHSGDQQTLTFNARGPLYYLRSMWVRTLLDYRDALAEDQHLIIQALIDQWQALDYGNLGIDTTQVIASGVDREILYDPAEEHNVYQRVIELSERINGFDLWVDLTTGPEERVLQLGTRGTDLTDTVVLDRRGLDQTSLAASMTADDLASDAFGAAHPETGSLTSEFADTDLRAAIGRRGVAATFDGVSEQATLDDYTEELQTTRRVPLVTPGATLIPVSGADVLDFGAGDTVQFVPSLGIETPEEPVVLTRRVLAKRITVDEAGNESIGVEFL